MSRADTFIRPPGFRGAAFTLAAAGDLRSADRGHVSTDLRISSRWATLEQVHGADVRKVHEAGPGGAGDALFTQVAGLPLAVFTADCAAVVMEGAAAVGAAHAGWRGTRARVVAALAHDMAAAGQAPVRAAIGPTIGPCCYEVGPEVRDEFGGFETTTSWGTPSVDLAAAIADQLAGLDVWMANVCTRCDDRAFSHRANRTPSRMAGLGWLP